MATVEHLSPEFVRQEAGPKNLPEPLLYSHLSNDEIVFLGERGDQIRVVSLASDSTGTRITLLRTAKPASQ